MTIKPNLFRLLIIVVGVIACLSFVCSLWLFQKFQNDLATGATEKASLLAQKMILQGEQAFKQKQILLLTEALKEFQNKKDIRYAFFVNSEGIILAHTNKEAIGKKQTGFFTSKALEEKRELILPDQGEHTLEIAEPLFTGGTFAGVARLTYSLENSEQKILWFNIGLIFQGFLLAGLILALWVLWKSCMERPLSFSQTSLQETQQGVGLLVASPSNMIISASAGLASLFKNGLVGKHLLDVMGQIEFSSLLEQSISGKGQWFSNNMPVTGNDCTIEILCLPDSRQTEQAAIIIHIRPRMSRGQNL